LFLGLTSIHIPAATVIPISLIANLPMVIENVREIPQLGRFAIRDMGMTVAAGMCIDVKPKNK